MGMSPILWTQLSSGWDGRIISSRPAYVPVHSATPPENRAEIRSLYETHYINPNTLGWVLWDSTSMRLSIVFFPPIVTTLFMKVHLISQIGEILRKCRWENKITILDYRECMWINMNHKSSKSPSQTPGSLLLWSREWPAPAAEDCCSLQGERREDKPWGHWRHASYHPPTPILSLSN